MNRIGAWLALSLLCALAGPAAAGAATNSIFTVAGTGVGGFSGDGGMATAAQINQTHTIDPTPTGGYLIADTGNHRIRRVSALGIISTVAGTRAMAAPRPRRSSTTRPGSPRSPTVGS